MEYRAAIIVVKILLVAPIDYALTTYYEYVNIYKCLCVKFR